LIEPIWESVSIYEGPETFVRQFGRLRPEVGRLFAAHWCHSEVCNGGFHQFFWNSTGVLAPEAVAGFHAIGLTTSAAVVAEAMQWFGVPYPRDRDERCDRLETLPRGRGRDRVEWDPFADLDERFYDSLRDEPGDWESAADAYAARVGMG
jgi:hypothetical protein